MLTRPTPARRKYRDPDDWQRTDGGVWLPRDPLRGAGMVRRGMGFGFEPAGCCCGCCMPTYTGTLPEYLQVDISGTIGSYCADEECAELDGTYIVGPNSAEGTQYWPDPGNWAILVVGRWVCEISPGIPLCSLQVPIQYIIVELDCSYQGIWVTNKTKSAPGLVWRVWFSTHVNMFNYVNYWLQASVANFANFKTVIVPYDNAQQGGMERCLGGTATISLVA